MSDEDLAGRAKSKRPLDPQGKAALFSGTPRADGSFVVECSGCGGVTRMGLLALVRQAFPANFTLPLRYHHTWLRCPACGRYRWVRIKRFG